jgi:peptidylprolyl isomerase
MANVKQIILVITVSMLLVAGLTYMVSRANTPELLLDESGELLENKAPLSVEALEEDNQLTITNTMNPIAIFTTNKGVFELELFEDQMPITVANFKKLIEQGYYDGTKFHRVIPGFMIQGGDSNSKGDDTSIYGRGGPGYTIADEFVEGELLTNTRGTISMANTGQPDSGGSQFFINTVDNINLDFNKEPFSSKHPVFGHVVSGMDVIDAISAVETGQGDIPSQPVVIESVVIK